MASVGSSASAALCGLLFAVPLNAQGTGTVQELLDSAAQLVQPLLEAKLCVGLTVGIYRNGDSSVRGFGRVAKNQRELPNGKTVYEIGSISKVFTGTLLADAVERGLVKLDGPIQNNLPRGIVAPVFMPKRGPEKLITFGHLTSHGSALPRLLPDHVVGRADPYDDYNAERLYAGLVQVELQRAPGSSFEYSNFAVGLLGQMLVEIQKKRDYEELLCDRICDPLDLTDTRVVLTDTMRKRLAPPYDDVGRRGHNWTFGAAPGMGGIRSTMDDMMTFAKANLGVGDQPKAAAHLPAAYALAQKPINVPNFMLQLGGAPSIACGWHINSEAKFIWHDGSTGGYRSNLILDAKSKIVVCVLANTNSALVHRVANQIFQLARGKPVKPLELRAAVSLAPKSLTSYMGKYRRGTDTVDVTVDDGVLMITVNREPRVPLLAASKTLFFLRRSKADIEFELKDGAATQLIWIKDGHRVQLARVQ
jgi:D-alanyl-D-alanine-carboxypeptidase/D-alanyl-D-alanine-endopeptidase